MEERTRQIIEKIAELYQKYGIRSLTMDDIARELGISKKTLYQLFEDKHDMVKQVIEYKMSEQEGCFHEIRTKDLNAIEEVKALFEIMSKQLEGYNPAMIYDIQKYYPELHSKIENLKFKYIYEHSLENLKRGRQEGFYRNDFDIDLIARMQLLRWGGLMDGHTVPIRELLTPNFLKEILKYHLYGIVSPKGLEYMNQQKITQ